MTLENFENLFSDIECYTLQDLGVLDVYEAIEEIYPKRKTIRTIINA